MLRRDFKLFVRCLALAFALILVIGALCLLAFSSFSKSNGEIYTPVRIAVVDREDSLVSRVLVNTVKNLHYVTELFKAEVMEEEAAMTAFRGGELAGVILLPENYLSDIYAGREASGTIYLSSSLQGQGEIIESVSQFGELLLLAGQNGDYAGETLLSEYNCDKSLYTAFYDANNNQLIHEAITGGERYFSLEMTSFSNTGMSTEAHYALCWMLMLLFLVSIVFVPLFTDDLQTDFIRRLYALGCREIGYLKYKYLLTFLFRLLLLGGAVFAAVKFLKLPFAWISVIWIILGAAYISIIGICLSMCFGNGILAVGIFSFAGLFLSGGIVPRQMMNATLLRIGDFLPFGAARSLLAPVYGASASAEGVLLCLLYAGISVIMIGFRMRGVLKGGIQQ